MKQVAAKNAIQTTGLGKRYGSFWALKDCAITVPQGSITALVGPNGAGKTTLLKLLISLNKPSAGSVVVLGVSPKQKAEYLAEIGYLAQEIPMFGNFSASEHIAMGAHLNPRWDATIAESRLQELGIPLNRPVGKLSGGQRAQVGLALALAKKPKLLLLDEPVAALDPLARVDFLSSLAQAVANGNGELTVVMSSHLLADLERVCDHVIILASGETQLCADIDDTLKIHKLLVGQNSADTKNKAYTVIVETHTPRQTTLLVRMNDGATLPDSHWQVHDVDIEEIVLAYMGQNRQRTMPAMAEGDIQ